MSPSVPFLRYPQVLKLGFRGPKKHMSISILGGYPDLIGLYYKGVYMGYPYPNFCLCAFLGP